LKLWPLLITSFLGLFVSSCQKAKPIEKVSVRHIRLDRDLIETSAIKREWRIIRSHILKVDGDALSGQNQAYALYWLGVSQHKLGDLNSAKRSWERALERRPDMKLTQVIRRAFQQTQSMNNYSSRSNSPSNSSGISSSKWILQLGIFSLKQTAENLSKKLKSRNINVNVRRSEFNGRTTWTVWAGPFSGTDAYNRKEELQNLGYAAILKRAEKFL